MRTNTHCRICRRDSLVQYLDFGATPLANAYLTRDTLAEPEPRYPLSVFFCETCGLSQLGGVVDPEVLYSNYVYFTSAMPRVPEHFRNYAEDTVSRFASKPGSLVVEIGSNDGILLSVAKNLGARVLGIDPAKNIAEVANNRGIPTLPEFFTEALARRIREEHGPAAVIIANNVVAHIDDHHDLVRGVKTLLADDGAFIFEAPYLVDMFERLSFGTIYHEHLSFLSLRPLCALFGQYGMEVFEVKTFPVQGTSLRVWTGQAGVRPVSPAVGELLRREEELGLHRLDAYHEFTRSIAGLRERVRTILTGLKADGKRIAAYGAPAQSNTLLHYFDIGRDLIEYATEELETKVGRYTPGTHIPILHVEEARKNQPDYFLLLAWNYLDAILEKEREFRARGGKFILPVGDARIV